MVELTKKQRHALYKKVLKAKPKGSLYYATKYREGICVVLNEIAPIRYQEQFCSQVQKHFPELQLFDPGDSPTYWWSVWDSEEQDQRVLAIMLLIEMTR